MADRGPAQLPEPQLRLVLWLAITTGAVLFVAVVSWVRLQQAAATVAPGLPLLPLAAAFGGLAGLLGSRVLARNTPAEPLRARSRFVAQLAVSEVGVLLGALAWLVTGNLLCWVALGAGFLALALAFPRAGSSGGGPVRMVR